MDGTWREPRKPSAEKHERKPDAVTVAGKPNDDLAPGTFNGVLKQAGLK